MKLLIWCVYCILTISVMSAEEENVPEEIIGVTNDSDVGFMERGFCEFLKEDTYVCFYRKSNIWKFYVLQKLKGEKFWRSQNIVIKDNEVSNLDLDDFPNISEGRKQNDISGKWYMYRFERGKWRVIINAHLTYKENPKDGKISILSFMHRKYAEVRDGWHVK